MDSKKVRRIILLVTLFVMISLVSFQTATLYAVNDITNDITFDSNYYSNRYWDLKAAFGNDKIALKRHFLDYGIKEGRVASEAFDVKYYLENSWDLKAAFGNNYVAAYNHFLKYGLNEKRVAHSTSHVYGKEEVTKEATCTEEGIKTSKCIICEKTKTEEYIDAENHDLQYVSTIVPAICPNERIEAHECTRCGVAKTVAVKSEHNYISIPSRTATCVQEGRITKVCTVCLDSIEEFTGIDSTVHRILTLEGQGKQLKAPTCTEEGIEEVTCEDCKKAITRKVAKIAHTSEIEGTITKEPTCEQTGIKTFKCTECDEVLKEEEIQTIAHDYKTYKTIQEVKCGVDGKEAQICINCNTTKEIIIPAPAHQFPSTPDTAATCTSNAKTHCENANCDFERVNSYEIPNSKLSHTEVTKEATCTQEGNITCSVCNEVLETIPVKPHTEVVKTQATCDAEGEKECSVCHTSLGAIPALGHTEVITEATCTTEGNIVCSVCNEVLETIPVKPHTEVIKTEATCDVEGEKECSVCHTSLGTIPALGHTEVVKTEATCDAEGERECSVCHISLGTISALGHKWSDTVVIPGQEATPEKPGKGIHVCEHCGISEYVQIQYEEPKTNS